MNYPERPHIKPKWLAAGGIRRQGIYWLPNAITTLALFAGFYAIVQAMNNKFELAAAAWEHDVLPARVADYGSEQIDQLCLSGRVAWGRLTPGTRAPLRSSPISLLLREHAAHWGLASQDPGALSSEAAAGWVR